MEKFGVVTEPDKEKTASDEKKKCPDCGKKLEDKDNTGVDKCPKDGTKPFEK
jgi:ribosomal protein L37AE/L43A